MKGKKPTCTLIVAMLILGLATLNVGTGTQSPKLFVDPQTYTATILGEVFTININVTNVQDLVGFEFKLGYNTTLLDALDIAEGPFPQPPISRLAKINETEGYVWISVTCGSTEGNGTLATINFTATYAESASCTLHLYDTELINDWGVPITHDVEDGNYEFVILGVTVATDKPFYYQGGNVEIHGNLTLDRSPHQGLVALEVDSPSNYALVVRTVQTGPTSPPGDVTILQVVTCDLWGNPKTSFKRGATLYQDLFYVKVTVKNNNPTEEKSVLIIANTYDVNLVPIGVMSVGKIPLAPGATSSPIISIPIPDWASLGGGKVYANAFTDWPGRGHYGDIPLNGTPYCPEESTTFQITGSSQGSAALEAQVSGNNSTAGNYSLTFKLPIYNVKAGNYTVYATSSYLRQQVMNSTTFEVIIRGDLNGDGKVSIADVKIMDLAYSGVIEEPRADLNDDGRITIADVKIMDNIYSGIII